jgi:hypothetical protein
VGHGFCFAAGLIVDPKERGSKKDFHSRRPWANVENPAIETSGFLFGIVPTGIGSG